MQKIGTVFIIFVVLLFFSFFSYIGYEYNLPGASDKSGT